MKFAKTLTAAVLALGLAFSAQAADKMKVAMVVKTLGNGFFDAAHQGADEAAKQLGDVEIIFTGPAQGDRRRSDRTDQFTGRAKGPGYGYFGQRRGRSGSGYQESHVAWHQGSVVRLRHR